MVTSFTYTDYQRAPAYSKVCSNGTYLYFSPTWYNYTFSYYDYSCVDPNTGDFGCFINSTFFYNETTYLYEYFSNKSYAVTQIDGYKDFYNYVILDIKYDYIHSW